MSAVLVLLFCAFRYVNNCMSVRLRPYFESSFSQAPLIVMLPCVNGCYVTLLFLNCYVTPRKRLSVRILWIIERRESLSVNKGLTRLRTYWTLCIVYYTRYNSRTFDSDFNQTSNVIRIIWTVTQRAEAVFLFAFRREWNISLCAGYWTVCEKKKKKTLKLTILGTKLSV